MKIPALRVEVNGILVAVAGADGLSLLTGMIGLGSGEGTQLDESHIMLSVMGLNVHATQPQQLTWAKGLKLEKGDRVTFEIVQTEQPSEPDQVIASPSSKQLSAESKRASTRHRLPKN